MLIYGPKLQSEGFKARVGYLLGISQEEHCHCVVKISCFSRDKVQMNTGVVVFG